MPWLRVASCSSSRVIWSEAVSPGGSSPSDPPMLALLTGSPLDRAGTGQDPVGQGEVGAVATVARPVPGHEVLVGHVTDQDPGDSEREVDAGGDLGDGDDVAAETGDGALLDGELGVRSPNEVVE